MQNAKILIVDDHKHVLSALKQILEDEYSDIFTLSNPNLIPNFISENDIDIVLLDMNFSAGINTGNEGLFWLNKIQEIAPRTIIILITAYGDINLAVNAIKKGAFDFILKPWDNQKLIATINKAIEQKYSKKKIKNIKKATLNSTETINQNPLIGNSEAFLNILHLIDKVAETDANILILGENGTGKDLIAHEIHKQSNRKNNRIVSIDLGAISENLFESELFGHKKGSFTDAKEDRIGKIETANKGTLFLDEITNISLTNQAKLLTVLQQKQIYPLGSNQKQDVDFRLISASNQDINKLIANNSFREDLFFRINTIQIDLPPLRKRKADIPLLAKHFMNQYKLKYKKPNIELSKEAEKHLTQYNWPGNIRELKHTIEKAVILSEKEILTSTDLTLNKPISKDIDKNTPQTLDEIEKCAIIRTLRNCNGNIKETAKKLGIARQTLYNKIQKYALE
ncbi:MAG: sigma-54 dependent transcriptional regulator [Bacteroidales bacterium]|nr:sigma-54 dependent transcriptional regulator [Bacteroidales bacterium]